MTVTWDGDEVLWDGSALVWGDVLPTLPPAPAWPASLLGEWAPKLLSYVPLYERSTFYRAVVQAIGYELDVVDLAVESIPEVGRMADCPPWALAWWEQAFGLAPASDWDTDERRAALVAHADEVGTGASYAGYVAAFGRCDLSDVEVVPDGFDLQVTVPDSLSEDDIESARSAALRALPVHMRLEFATA